MDILDEAEAFIWEYLNDVKGMSTEFISTGGTLSNLMCDGWTPTEIVNGKANDFIVDNIYDL